MRHANRPFFCSFSAVGALVVLSATTLFACSSESDSGADTGTPGVGGSTGGQVATGGAGTGGAGTGGAAATGGSGTGGAGPGGSETVDPSALLHVEGAKLLDRCGEQVVLRGVNEMIVWSAGRDGVPEFSEIAKTGANTVRVVWNEEGTAAELDVAITNALAAQLIPIIEHHSATGDLTKLPTVVDYWVSPDVVAVIKKHEKDLLLNIANESGDGDVNAATFQAAYETAITRLRGAGLGLPLIIDAPSWGQNIDVLQATWQALESFDPQKNLLFSVHMWWSDADGTRVKQELAESVTAGMPLIVGEFAQHAVYNCSAGPFAYSVLLEEAQKAGIGWLAWSWGGVVNNDCKDDGSFDMTTGGVYGDWKETWGEDVAVTNTNSIKNTSVRPKSITTGACE